MSDTETETEKAPEAERDHLMGMAYAGQLNPAFTRRLDELNLLLDDAGQQRDEA
jgi:hypothetical protein